MTGLLGALSAVFWGLILLSVLVFIHEGGHFIAARLNHIRVTEFFLGLPCKWRLAKTSKEYGTTYGVTPLLLGGYTQVCGMAGETDAHTADVFRIVSEKGRVAVADIAEELGIEESKVYDSLEMLLDWASVEAYYDEALGEKPDQKDYPRSFQTVARDGAGLTVFDKGHDMTQPGSTQAGEARVLDPDPAKALELEKSHTYEGKGFWARVSVLAGGVFVNLVFGFILVVFVLSAIGLTGASGTNEVASVSEGSLAAQSGIVAGDTIDSIAGTETPDWAAIGTALDSALASGEDFEVVTTHDGVTTTHAVEQNGESHEYFGIVNTQTTIRVPLGQSIPAAWNYIALTATTIAQLFQPQHAAEVIGNSTSVVGISVMASQAAAEGAASLLTLAAAVSLSLGFMNLLPIPPLDGGKLVIEVIQVIIRRPVSIKVQTAISYVGIALFLLLFFVLLRQDIIRFVLGG